MTKEREALKLALEALKKCDAALAEELAAWDIDPPLHHVQEASNACGPAITAIREALDEQPAQRKPLHIGDESAAFKAWFDAWWVGDGEQGETIPTQSDKHFLTYLDQYTLGFGAWMAAKHAAHGITGEQK